MPDLPPPLFAAPAPSADRPLAGVTLLLVEDSRFASEAVRLLCLRSGARIRRADCLRTAERHLSTYRPTAALIDLGLPDGSGIDLIARLAAARPRLQAILAISGDPGLREAALAAGADAFLEKPVPGLIAFQGAVLSALGVEGIVAQLGREPADRLEPDPLAYRDDLALVCDLLQPGVDARSVAYAAQFLAGVARSAADPVLAEAAGALSDRLGSGAPTASALARVAGLVAQRLDTSAPAERRLA